jgi:hypothetical protein
MTTREERKEKQNKCQKHVAPIGRPQFRSTRKRWLVGPCGAGRFLELALEKQ